jgi:hypothetical protein
MCYPSSRSKVLPIHPAAQARAPNATGKLVCYLTRTARVLTTQPLENIDRAARIGYYAYRRELRPDGFAAPGVVVSAALSFRLLCRFGSLSFRFLWAPNVCCRGIQDRDSVIAIASAQP